MFSLSLVSLLAAGTLTEMQIQEKIEQRVDSSDYVEPPLLAHIIYEESEKNGVDPLLVLSVISVESAFRPNSISNVGAIGLMQVMPMTFREMNEDPDANIWNPYLNVIAGIKYLGLLKRQFGDTDVTLMAYNAGPRRILSYRKKRQKIPSRFWSYPRQVRVKRVSLRRAVASY